MINISFNSSVDFIYESEINVDFQHLSDKEIKMTTEENKVNEQDQEINTIKEQEKSIKSFIKNNSMQSNSENQMKNTSNKKWYIIHVAANCERHIQTEIQQKAIEDGLTSMIEEIFIPSYKATVIQRGKRQEIDKKTMPGYILIKMNLNTHTVSLIKSIKKVSNFLGGLKPNAVSEEEVQKIRESIILQSEMDQIIPYNIGDAVEINSGPFETFQGNIKEVDVDKSKLKVIVYVFGRQNIIELDMSSVKKI